MKKLETLLGSLPYDSLPPEWTTLDLARFSRSKKLFDYQQTALQNAIKALYLYHQPAPAERKPAFFQFYADNDIQLPDLFLGRKRDNADLLAEFYPLEEERLAFSHLVNRMGYWMATGSGKTLVIVKLLEVLRHFMRAGLIPLNDVMVLTHREDLLKQLQQHVAEFNAGGGDLLIRLHELKEYPEVKRAFPRLLGQHEISVFFYRSDNLSDEQKDKIVDFHNYDNNGRWYLLLDEAHKGDKEDSKRQHIYSILSRNGFLFNFSATFTENSDKLTTAAEFNLASFIQAGYGKHIAILQRENRAFRKEGDFTDDEKQRIVLQSLLLLTYLHKTRASLLEAAGGTLYHRPLLLALVNSVNTEEADLKLFFAQLVKIARGRLDDEAFSRARKELWRELEGEPEWLYEDACCTLDEKLFNSLTLRDVLREVFNAGSHSEIEVLTRPSNDKELAFKLKSSEKPFALIRIGNTAEWLKNVLADYEFVSGFSDESFFTKLNSDDSEITLLMGSRSFYEGWDSNRPNVITFINIGTGTDAKKFILQSVGRGVRIEPLKGFRKRLAPLHTAGQVDSILFRHAGPFLKPIETLFIFGTNRAALESVFNELDQEKEKEEGVELALKVNSAAQVGQTLLIPVYRKAQLALIEQRVPKRFELPDSDLLMLQGYVDYLGDDRLLLAHHDLSPRQIKHLKTTLGSPRTYFKPEGGRRFGQVGILLPRLVRYFDLIPAEFDSFKPVENEINHYEHIRVLLKDIEELRRKVAAVQAWQNPDELEKAIYERFTQGELDFEGYRRESSALRHLPASAEETFAPPGRAVLKIKNLAAHYYLPLLLSEDTRMDYMRHIITVESEITFLRQLEEYLKEPGNLFGVYDWWMFSKTDESLDRVVIPYYDPASNRMREFHPDFIFWLRKGEEYTILFVDPKGMQNTDYQYKLDGYNELFLDPLTHQPRVIPYNRLKVRVALAMHNPNAEQAPLAYLNAWVSHPREILEHLKN